ncbi:Ribonuclease H [subsurface metagenome]
MTNPYAIYVFCDGTMDYDSESSGGIGFVIFFPDSIALDDIPISIGRYTGGNIERIEMEALIQSMKTTIEVFNKYNDLLKNINQVIFITDRFGLCDSEITNPYKIKGWRSNKWKNHEGKPIKNHKLLDELDKTRKKLSNQTFSRINIEYSHRKKNKIADKLTKSGKKEGITTDRLSKKGEKIGTRKYQGNEIKYTKLQEKEELHLHVFRKDPVQDEWEIWVEVCNGLNKEVK